MADLADEVLSLLATSESRWHTLRAAGREWRDDEPLHEAWEAGTARTRAQGIAVQTLTSQSGGDARAEVGEDEGTDQDGGREETWRLWLAPPWKRAQFEVGDDSVDVVFKDSTWWSNGHGESRTNNGLQNYGHGEGDGAYLVSTEDYPPWLDVEEVGVGSRLDRETLDARVTLRDGPDFARTRALHGLMIGDADEMTLSVDRERGVLLWTEARFHGSVYRIVEVIDVGFDEELSPSVFKIEPLPGQNWDVHTPAFPLRQPSRRLRWQRRKG